MSKSLLEWHVKSFDELTGQEMHGLLKLRQDVFVIEQDCIYPDIDSLDSRSSHVFCVCPQRGVVAYARLVEPKLKYQEPSIGRVVVLEALRKYGVGRELMLRALAHADLMYPEQANRISAQAHLHDFYSSLGYEQVSDVYDEDGIPHIEMLRQTLS